MQQSAYAQARVASSNSGTIHAQQRLQHMTQAAPAGACNYVCDELTLQSAEARQHLGYY
jgi:hypothetical protein